MKRYSEVVLNGHPDKFCDILADRIISQAYQMDPEAYAQVEVSVWSDQLFFTGGVVTSQKLEIDLKKIIVDTGTEIGYTSTNHIDAAKYNISDHICWLTDAPRKWSEFVNDQAIVIGYAGYDASTRFLPPEHYASWYFREKIIQALNPLGKSIHLSPNPTAPFRASSLAHLSSFSAGPDGKILVIMDENPGEWCIKTLLLTLQQQEASIFTEFTQACSRALREAYDQLRESDSRWIGDWKDINVLVNPNGPLVNGGSDGDNGQTGRKLVMDYYGPRIPLGGGALYGKDLTHIDRLGSYATRKYALELMARGASEAMVTICYAPGMNIPLDITLRTDIKPHIDPYGYFDFNEMRKLINCDDLAYKLDKLGTFYNTRLSFNRLE
jgi:S-adenosylmethionine synthetase